MPFTIGRPTPSGAPAIETPIELEPIQIHTYGHAGSTTVVLLYGGPGAPGSVADLARDLAPDFHVIEPLQRRAVSIPLTVKQHVDDLTAVAPDPAVLIGHSLGAMLALSFAARHPHRVRSLTLIGCGTYDLEARAAYRNAVDRLLNPDDRARLDEIDRQLNAATDQTARDLLFAEFGKTYSRLDSFDPLPRAATPLAPTNAGSTKPGPTSSACRRAVSSRPPSLPS